MSKQLRIWLFALLGTLLTSTSLLAESVITMTTSLAVGDEIFLEVRGQGFSISGTDKKWGYYAVRDQTITIRGKVTYLRCCGSSIKSLDVSGCPSLEELVFDNNQLTSLDVSKNSALTVLRCGDNQLTSLDVSKNSALTTLSCYGNQLTSLDVSKNTALTELWCDGNQLTSLDVSKNTALTRLDCNNNQLTSLDVADLTDLTYLNCDGNQLTSLDLSGRTALREVDCRCDSLTSIDLSKCESLKAFEFTRGQLASLNLSGCTALTSLDCSNNQLTSLDVSGCTNLTSINCYENNINGEAMTKLVKGLPYSSGGRFWVAMYFDDKNRCSFRDVAIARSKGWDVQKYRPDGGFTKYSGVGDGIITITTTSAVGEVVALRVKANGDVAIEGVQEYEEKYHDDYRYTYYIKKLTSQTITIRGDVTYLFCVIDSLTSLDVSGCPSLTKLNCPGSQLTSLDLSQNPALTELDCSENKLTSLDLSKNPALTELNCSENKLTSLDLSPCPNLKSLKCYLNRIRGKAMTQLVESLPNRSRMETSTFYLVCYSEDDYEENLCYRSDVECASNKNWTPQKGERTYDKKVVIWRYRWEDYFGVKDEGVVKMRTAQKVGSKITLTLEAEGNVAIDGVKGVPKTDGKPHQYTLLSQDVTIHGYVTKLDCSGNKLTSLDLTTTAPLVELNCSNNQLTALDVSQNAALTSLACYRNQIKGEAMAQLIKGLPQLQLEDTHLFGIVSNAPDEGNVFLKADVERVRDKGWSPMRWNEERQQYEPYAGKETETFAVTLTKEGEGTLSATGADDLKAVLYDTELSIEATPATGYELTALTANGTDILATKKVTIKEAVEVKATFTKKTFAVTLTSNEHGDITIVESVDLKAVPYGTTLTVKAKGKNAQCVLTELTANGEDILATQSFVVTGPTEVKATFVDHTGVETTVTQQTQLYPNPATDYVIVEGVAATSEVTLHSMTGERLYAGRADDRGTLQIDLTPYADGVYLVCVAGKTYRVVVRH